MITQQNYLDVGNLLINEIIGSVWLFLAIAIIILIFYSVKHSFDLKTMLALMFVTSIGTIGYYFQQEVLVIAGLVFAFIVYMSWSKVISR